MAAGDYKSYSRLEALELDDREVLLLNWEELWDLFKGTERVHKQTTGVNQTISRLISTLSVADFNSILDARASATEGSELRRSLEAALQQLARLYPMEVKKIVSALPRDDSTYDGYFLNLLLYQAEQTLIGERYWNPPASLPKALHTELEPYLLKDLIGKLRSDVRFQDRELMSQLLRYPNVVAGTKRGLLRILEDTKNPEIPLESRIGRILPDVWEYLEQPEFEGIDRASPPSKVTLDRRWDSPKE